MYQGVIMRCAVLKENTLPAKPIDPSGRPVWWVDVLSEDTIFTASGEQHRVGIDGIERQLAAFAYMTSRGYQPPVGGEHDHPFSLLSSISSLKGALEEMPVGWRQGDMLAMELWEDEAGKLHAIGAVALALPNDLAEMAIGLGAIKYFSPELGPLELDDGSVLPLVVKKLDIVERPHQKNAMSHILASEVIMDESTTIEAAEEVTLASLAEMVKANSASIASLIARFEEPDEEEPVEEEEEEEEAEMSEESAALAEATSRITALECQRDEATFAHLLPAGATIELTESVRQVLFNAYRSNTEGWVDGLGKSVSVPERTSATLSEAQKAWTKSVGSGNAPTPRGEGTPEALYAQCLTEADGDAVKAHTIFKQRRLN